MRFLSLFLAVVLMAASVQADPLVEKLQDISVTIQSGRSQGSGTMFTRKVGDDTVTYIWTAAHVVDNLRKMRPVVINGNPKLVVEFEDAQVVQEFRQDGRCIGERKMYARVIRYSDAQEGEDLALLEIRKRNFVPADTTTAFYESDEAPDVGTELYHVGSLLGQLGSNSLTSGIMSQQGRVLALGANGVVFDQTTVTAFPGSSGGGVFLKGDGRYVGMLVRGAGEQFNFIVPVRRLRAWAKSAKVEWAIDQNVAMPSADELKKLPIEDTGVDFGPQAAMAPGGSRPHEDINKEFPFLLLLTNPKAPLEPMPAALPMILGE